MRVIVVVVVESSPVDVGSRPDRCSFSMSTELPLRENHELSILLVVVAWAFFASRHVTVAKLTL